MRRISLSFLMLAAISTALPAYAQAVVYRNNTRVDRSASHEKAPAEKASAKAAATTDTAASETPKKDEKKVDPNAGGGAGGNRGN